MAITTDEGFSKYITLLHETEVTAAITGTITAAVDEADIVAGGKTIIITLTGGEWVQPLPENDNFDAIKTLIIDGLDSAQSETTGWNNEVRDKTVISAVARTSDTVVTVTLAAQSGYDITAQETITVTVDSDAIDNYPHDVIAAPTFTVDFAVSFPHSWEYRANAGPSSEDCYRTPAVGDPAIDYVGADDWFTCIELESGDVLDFDSGTWSGPFAFGGNKWVTQIVRANNIIYSIVYDTGTTDAVYYLTKNGFNNYSRANMCSDASLSDCDDQLCDKVACP